ncbi:MAG: tripartite tricarboxylate transporter substrate binding protein [Deltaproteobacteria bacterium]|nr:tripartite tricarboxylate transporter substrate binding protein [Deltaproteobacteria bacterium]
MKKQDQSKIRYWNLFFFLGLIFLFTCAIAGPAGAADKFPSRSINLVVPYAPGGASDLASKILADKMGEFLGQPFISQYKPGGGGSLGAAFVAKAKPDGYTVLVGSSTPLVLSPIVKKMDYKWEDFLYMGIYGGTPIWVAVKKESPWKTLKDLVEEAKKSPGSVTVGSYGKLTAADFVIEMLNKQAGIKLTHVPYKSTAEAMSAVLGGHAQAAFVTGAGGLLESGTVKIIAAATDQRLEALPEIPTFKELGYSISLSAWYTFCVPKGTPKEVVDPLVEAQKKAFEKYAKEIREGMARVEVWANFHTPQETIERFKREYGLIYKVAEELGVLAK